MAAERECVEPVKTCSVDAQSQQAIANSAVSDADGPAQAQDDLRYLIEQILEWSFRDAIHGSQSSLCLAVAAASGSLKVQ